MAVPTGPLDAVPVMLWSSPDDPYEVRTRFDDAGNVVFSVTAHVLADGGDSAEVQAECDRRAAALQEAFTAFVARALSPRERGVLDEMAATCGVCGNPRGSIACWEQNLRHELAGDRLEGPLTIDSRGRLTSGEGP